ncbi:hypothetical protein TKK_0015054 [Trichogramma kaykai]
MRRPVKKTPSQTVKELIVYRYKYQQAQRRNAKLDLYNLDFGCFKVNEKQKTRYWITMTVFLIVVVSLATLFVFSPLIIKSIIDSERGFDPLANLKLRTHNRTLS